MVLLFIPSMFSLLLLAAKIRKKKKKETLSEFLTSSEHEVL